jgi:hypothetical protein
MLPTNFDSFGGFRGEDIFEIRQPETGIAYSGHV